MFLSDALSRLHIEVNQDVPDVIPLNFLQYLNACLYIIIMNALHKLDINTKQHIRCRC